MPEIAYVNGSFCDLGQATVSIEDRGFQFADGVYEVIIAYGGVPFRLEDHLERLRRSLDLIDMPIDRASVDFEALVGEGIERCGFDPTMAYVQVTRGACSRSHVYAANMQPTVVATFKAKPVITEADRAKGVRLVTIDDTRWARCEVKSIALLPNVLAKNRALRDGYDDAIFVGPCGRIREATSANVFAARDGRLITPATDESILRGVTRRYVLECARVANVPVEEAPLTVAELESADEAFLSSSVVEVLPIGEVNGQSIGGGGTGAITERIYRIFLDGLPGR